MRPRSSVNNVTVGAGGEESVSVVPKSEEIELGLVTLSLNEASQRSLVRRVGDGEEAEGNFGEDREGMSACRGSRDC